MHTPINRFTVPAGHILENVIRSHIRLTKLSPEERQFWLDLAKVLRAKMAAECARTSRQI